MKKIKNGFTLIELLVVVLIIGILAAVALPQYKKAVQKSRNSQLKNLVKEVAQAQQAYLMANGSISSSFDNLDINWDQYTTAASTSICSFMTSDNNAVRRTKDFEVIINKFRSYNYGYIVAYWRSGKYKCTGFQQAVGVSGEHPVLKCMETRNGSSTVSPGEFCEKIESAVLEYEGSGAGPSLYKL